jgi:hypothetical protein
LELRERLRAAQVEAIWGWRGGTAVHLVSLDGLKSTFPNLAHRTRLPGLSLQERGIELLPESLGPVGGTSDDSTKGSKPGMTPHPDLKKLQGEIEEASAQNATLLAQLVNAKSELEPLLDSLQGRESKPVPSEPIRLPDPSEPTSHDKLELWNRIDAEQKQLDLQQRRSQRNSWSVTALLTAVLVIIISYQTKLVLFASGGPDPAGEPPMVDPERSPLADELLDGLGSGSVFAQTGEPLTLWDADEQAAQYGANSELASFEQATGVSSDALEPPMGLVPDALSTMEEPTPTDLHQETELVPIYPDAPLSPVPAPVENVAPIGSDVDLAPVVLSQDAPCRYSKLTASGQPMREVLGPCIGPWNPETQAVAGSFRHSGERYCRHHLIVAKDLGGSVDRARNVAEYALQEGLLPPLIRLRVEHGAADLLQKRIGKWVESGFEAGLSGDHTVQRAEGEDRWTIQSWVRLQPKPGETADLRHFSMELQWAADQGRDRWISFTWMDKE